MDHTNMSAHKYEATNHKEGTDTSPTTTMGLQNISTKEELLYGQPPKFLTRPSLDNSTQNDACLGGLRNCGTYKC
ncbi:hypothetical protein Peur_039459 [Populus x canadensis]